MTLRSMWVVAQAAYDKMEIGSDYRRNVHLHKYLIQYKLNKWFYLSLLLKPMYIICLKNFKNNYDHCILNLLIEMAHVIFGFVRQVYISLF